MSVIIEDQFMNNKGQTLRKRQGGCDKSRKLSVCGFRTKLSVEVRTCAREEVEHQARIKYGETYNG